MCGIAGSVGPSPDQRAVLRMTRNLAHRGPDGEAFWSAAGVSLGHRRLKIIDLSDNSSQPMTTPDGRFTIVYNGEIYNYLELRSELAEVRWRSTSDTEVLLHAFAKWGTDCLDKLVGMFAFAIWDNERRELICARDRFGIKPFYYTIQDHHFLFASEIAALLAAGVSRDPDDRTVYDFLARDFYDHSDRTFFKQISQLPSGTWMRVREGVPDTSRHYWHLAEAVAAIAMPKTIEQRTAGLVQHMWDAVDVHLRSDVPIGVALSGGLDSAMLLALLDKVHPEPAHIAAFSFCFDDMRYSERPAVERMAAHTGHTAEFINTTPADFAADAIASVVQQQEPHAGLPVFAYGRCFARARQHGCIVMLDGSGVDEGMAGYSRFLPAYWADLRSQGQADVLASEITASAAFDGRIGSTWQRKPEQVLSEDVGLGQDLTRSVRPDCLNPDFVAQMAGTSFAFELPFPDALRNLMYRELRYTKLPRALRFRDRLSMAVGCELRPPFLDHRLMAYEFALPPEDKIKRGRQKYLVRLAAERLLPEATRLTPKQSVQTPQREWFRGELRQWIFDQIDVANFWDRGWVRRDAALAALEGFMRGDGDNSFFIWQWINVAAWYNTFCVAGARDEAA